MRTCVPKWHQLPERKANKTLVTTVHSLPGTDGYRPLEYGNGKYGVFSDVYSYGVVSTLKECLVLFVIES